MLKNPIKFAGAIFPALFFSLFITSCESMSYTTEDDGVVIKNKGVTTTLTVVNESIIHVQKEDRNSKESTLEDYVTVLKPQDVEWSVSEAEGVITLSTEAVTATVSESGAIVFADAEGNVLLSECENGAYLTPDTAKLHKVVQKFEAGDEALYGLGQYQSGIMNWKNTPVRMTQENQEIVVPFLVSTNGYGIYWHNYSVTDFNYPENELEFTEVVDSLQNHRRGTFTPAQSGEYTFWIETGLRRDKLAELRIDGEVVTSYSTPSMPESFSGKAVLEAGKTYTVDFINSKSLIPGRAYYNEPDFNKSTFSSKYGTSIDYYFVEGSTPATVIDNYTDLTGKAPMFDKSVFGFWQCRERYHNQKELLDIANEMRQKDVPFDYIVQDWYYWPKDKKSPHWDREKYPDPAAMAAEVHKLNAKIMVSAWTQVVDTPLLDNYGLEGRKLFNHYLDTYDREVADGFYKILSDSMFHYGINSIWLDGTEPQKKPEDSFMTGVGPFGEVANAYSMTVTETAYNGHRKEFGDTRVFNLTRSGYAGQQRYGAGIWSGDISGTWEQFNEQIPAGLNIVMAGLPYWTTDIGGFFRDSKSQNPVYDSQYTNPEYVELLTRWFQFGAFCPLFRIHGFVSNTEIWNYGKPFEEMARKFLALRYSLLPYIYSQSRAVTTDGALMISPLAYQYPQDKNCWDIKDQFFFGESILVNPVMDYKARERKLYLPEGNWFDFWTNEKIAGSKEITASAELNTLPLYVKEGAIIPFGPKVSYANEPTSKATELRIYPGKDGKYTLYLDDCVSYDYENGEYSTVEFVYNDKDATLTIAKGEGDYFDNEVKSLNLNVTIAGSKTKKAVKFSGKEVSVKL